MTGKTEENTKRIAKNTLVLYFRMFFNMVLSLFTSRMVLAALGETDYGVYNAVGGVVAMFSILTSSMTSAISRFQTFELGRENESRLKSVFSMSMWIQIFFGLVAFVLIETVGVWFLNTKMTIPEGRLVAANWVLQCVAVTFVSSITVTPYSASVISHEDMGVFAWISIYETVFKFIVALLLTYCISKIDELILYAILLAISTLSVQVVYRFYCHKHYDECCIEFVYDKSIAKGIFSFAGWNFLGKGASLLSTQGINIVLNVVFGPVVNAARGLALTVNNVLIGFSNNFFQALNPQIVKSYAAEDRQYTTYLLQRGARFAFYLYFIVALPVILETEFLLDLWLVDVPDHTVNFVRLVLVVTMIDLLSISLGSAQMATGKIREYEVLSGLVQLIYFIVSIIAFKVWNSPPEIVYVIGVFSSLIMIPVRWICIKRTMQLSFIDYCREVYLRVAVVIVAASVLPILLWHFTAFDGWRNFILVLFACLISSSFAIFFLGCSASERLFIKNSISRLIGFRKE